jgi:thioredoxin reductase (NADPH)
MEVAVLPLLAEYGVALEVLDADADPALERYDERVPVLLWGEKEICHYFLDEAGTRAVLAQLTTGHALARE